MIDWFWVNNRSLSLTNHCRENAIIVVDVVVVSAYPAEAVALPRGDHDWRQHTSRGQQAGCCCPDESGQPICCGDGLGDDSIGYLVDVRAIGQHDSWVLCELEQPGDVTEERVAVMADWLWGWRQTFGLSYLVVPNKLVPFDLQELPLTFHIKCFEDSA